MLDVIQGEGTVDMAGELGALPAGQIREDFFSSRIFCSSSTRGFSKSRKNCIYGSFKLAKDKRLMAKV
jgi:hypothetical protein